MMKFPAALIAIILIATSSCGNSNKESSEDGDTIVPVEEVAETPNLNDESEYLPDNGYSSESSAEAGYEVPAEDPATRRYREKYAEVYSADCHRMYEDGRILCYNYWREPSGYDNKLYVYDSHTDREKIVNLNRTSLADDEMRVTGMQEQDGVLTIIMEEIRNSNGWVEGTYVWQYNCLNGRWKPLAKACSGAEFVDGGRAVEVNYAECLNPEAFTYEQKYRNHYKTIKL